MLGSLQEVTVIFVHETNPDPLLVTIILFLLISSLFYHGAERGILG